jgi:orotate phosphoribosyltransferase
MPAMQRSTAAGHASQPPRSAPDALLDALWDRGLILLGDRVMEEYALHTPIFIDLRHKLYDDVGLLSNVGAALHRKLLDVVAREGRRDRPQQVIGIPDTATPLALAAAMAARSTPMPLFYSQMRKHPAAYPGGESGLSSYMGTRDRNREITLIDDVMASGRTKLWAIDELKKDGLEVMRILVVVDREQGGDEILTAKGVPTYSLYRVSEMISYYRDRGRVDAETARRAIEHLRSKRFR